MRAVFLVLMWAACGVVAFGQDLTVSFLEGSVEVRDGSSWRPLTIGAMISPGSTVRIGQKSYLEISSDTSTISLSESGSYSLKWIFSERERFRSTGVAQSITSHMAALLDPGISGSTTMGVRGAKINAPSGITWMSSDAQMYLESGRSLIQKGDYRGAIAELKTALDSASATEAPVVRYYLSYAYSSSGDTRKALEQAAQVNPSDLGDRAADLVLLEGKLLVDGNAYGQDIRWLTTHSSLIGSEVERRQLYYFLLGLGYSGARAEPQARKSYRKVVSIDGATDLARTARRLLEAR